MPLILQSLIWSDIAFSDFCNLYFVTQAIYGLFKSKCDNNWLIQQYDEVFPINSFTFAPVISPKVCLLYIDPVTPEKYTFRAYSTICALSGIVSFGTVLYISIISFGPCINPGSFDCKNYGKISLTNYAEKVQFNSLYGQTIDISSCGSQPISHQSNLRYISEES